MVRGLSHRSPTRPAPVPMVGAHWSPYTHLALMSLTLVISFSVTLVLSFSVMVMGLKDLIPSSDKGFSYIGKALST
jgi:hypothetical protein